MATTPHSADTPLDGLIVLLLRARLRLRLIDDAPLPEHKGELLWGGFDCTFHQSWI